MRTDHILRLSAAALDFVEVIDQTRAITDREMRALGDLRDAILKLAQPDPLPDTLPDEDVPPGGLDEFIMRWTGKAGALSPEAEAQIAAALEAEAVAQKAVDLISEVGAEIVATSKPVAEPPDAVGAPV